MSVSRSSWFESPAVSTVPMRPAAPVISTFMREWLTADGPVGVDGAGAGVRGGLEPTRVYGLRPLKRGFDGRAMRADPGAVSAAISSAFRPLQRRLHARVLGGTSVHWIGPVRKLSRAGADAACDDAERAGRGARPVARSDGSHTRRSDTPRRAGAPPPAA